MTGQFLSIFTHVYMPTRLTSDTEGQILVADCGNHRILLLTAELELERVLVDRDSQVKLQWPEHFSYNELTSQLYVVHGSDPQHVISVFNLR